MKQASSGILLLSIGTIVASIPLQPANAEIVRLKDGTSFAGRVVEESPTSIRLKSGTADGPKELTFATDDVVAVRRTMDEVAEINSCIEPTVLRRWCEGYFHSDMAILAVQCVERLVVLDAGLKARICDTGSAEYQIFWNRLIFRQRFNSPESSTGAGLLGLAKWADAAGLKADARETLRRAAFADPTLAEVRQLAELWKVSLASWIRVDLTPAIEMSLFMSRIVDQGAEVEAQAGREFFLLPLHYETDVAARVLSRLILPKRDRSAYYGVYSFHRQPTAAVLQSWAESIVFERMELKSTAGGEVQVVWKNNLLPRVRDGEKWKQEAARSRSESERPAGWAVLVLEPELGQREIVLEWGDGSVDVIDLAFIRSIREIRTRGGRIEPDTPELVQALRHLGGRSAAMVELSVETLGMVRAQVTADRIGNWARTVDPVVIALVNRGDYRIDRAVWRYIASRREVPMAAMAQLQSLPHELKLKWIELIGEHGADQAASDSTLIKSLLMSMCSNGSIEECEASLVTMRQLRMKVDWAEFSRISQNAQMAALRQLGGMRGEDAATALLTIMKHVQQSSAAEVARHVRSLGLELSDPRDPLLLKWRDLKSNSDRISLLTVLQPAALNDLVFSRTFAEIVKAGIEAMPNQRGLRRAIFDLVIEQGERFVSGVRLLENEHGVFPLNVRLRMDDPMIAGLVEAARSGSMSQRINAASILVRAGYPAIAADAVSGSNTKPEDTKAIIAALLDRPATALCDGMLGLCGHLLRPESVQFVEPLLGWLSRRSAETPVAEHWRLIAAMKTGVDFQSLAELVSVMRPTQAIAAQRILFEAGHFTAQDRQVFVAAKNAAARQATLAELDLRRAQLVDGNYGVVIVAEVIEAADYSIHSPIEDVELSAIRWRAPHRVTLYGPPVRLASSDIGSDYQVYWENGEIGRGRSRSRLRPVRRPEGSIPALADPSADLLGVKGWGWPGPTGLAGFEVQSAVGPVVLPSTRPVLDEPGEDFATLELTNYAAALLPGSGLLSAEDWGRLSATPLRVTVRYAAFASYVGLIPMREPPLNPAPGQRHLLGMLVMLERIDP